MSELEDLADKILKSESHRSFATESWVRETISGLRWTAVQGAIYQGRSLAHARCAPQGNPAAKSSSPILW
jgi:hypothetical protein